MWTTDVKLLLIWWHPLNWSKNIQVGNGWGSRLLLVGKYYLQAFFPIYILKLTKECLGGSYIVIKSCPIVPGGAPLMSIGYNYSSSNVLVFIATEEGVSTEPGYTCLYYFYDNYSNFSFWPIVCPHLLVRYLNTYNTIDNHNRMWQYELALDKYWVTQKDNIRIATTVALDMRITDGKIL